MASNILQPPPTTKTIPGWSWSNTPAPQPPTINYPTASQTAFNEKAVPGTYANWFASTISPFDKYYTTVRGGADEATRDYQRLLSFWQSQTGRPASADEVSRMMYGFGQYARSLGRQATVPDLFDYVQRIFYQPPAPPQVSVLQMGEI